MIDWLIDWLIGLNTNQKCDFQSSKNDVINEEILTDCENSIKWMPKPVTTPINKLPLVWNTVTNMASGGIVRIKARDVLTQNDFYFAWLVTHWISIFFDD